MDTYLIVKYLHLLSVMAAIAVTTIIHFNLVRVKKADQVPQALDALATVQKLGPRMPLAALALFLTGAYLTQNRWGFGLAFVQVGIAGLASMLVVGLAVLRPRMGTLGKAFGQAGSGPVTDDLKAKVRDPAIWIGSHYQPIMAATVMFLMTIKPGMMGSLIAIGVAIVLSVGSAAPMMKRS